MDLNEASGAGEDTPQSEDVAVEGLVARSNVCTDLRFYTKPLPAIRGGVACAVARIQMSRLKHELKWAGNTRKSAQKAPRVSI